MKSDLIFIIIEELLFVNDFLVANIVDISLYLSSKAFCSFGLGWSTPSLSHLVCLSSVPYPGFLPLLPPSSLRYLLPLLSFFWEACALSWDRASDSSLRLFPASQGLEAGPLQQWTYLFISPLLLLFARAIHVPSWPLLSVDGCVPPIMEKEICRAWIPWLSVHIELTSKCAHSYLLSSSLWARGVPFPRKDQSLFTNLFPLSFLGVEPWSIDYFLSIWYFYLIYLYCLEPIHKLRSFQSLKCQTSPSVLSTILSFSFPARPVFREGKSTDALFLLLEPFLQFRL